jgi:2-polyprenyl-3-methyl-5-hydroxy-6-metoxy-1,4-benzoquinol methylase
MSDSADKFTFKEIDDEGLDTLKVISAAKNFNKWTYQTIVPYCSGNILEIGSGIGNISKYFIDNNHDITLSDLRKNYRDALFNSFKDASNLKGVVDIDLSASDFEDKYPEHTGKYDTVFALNVVEHIEDELQVFENFYSLLKKNGMLIILVPAYNFLYNRFDKELMHFRRYNNTSLQALFKKDKFRIITDFYFNAAGIPAWFISGKIQENKTIPSGQMKFFDKIVPVMRFLDKILFKRIGLSVVCVGKKVVSLSSEAPIQNP